MYDSTQKSMWEILNKSINKNNAIAKDIYDKTEYLKNNPLAEKIRAELISKLVFFAYEFLGINDFSQRLTFFPEIYNQMELYQKYHNKENKRINYLITVHSIIKTQCLILEGKFVEAFDEYKNLMNNPKILSKDVFKFADELLEKEPQLTFNIWHILIGSLYRLIYNIVQISLLYNNETLTDSLCLLGREYIEFMKNSYIKELNILQEDPFNCQICQEESIKQDLFLLENIKKFNSLRLNDDSLINVANNYAYENILHGFLLGGTYCFEYKPDTLFIVDYHNKKEYAQINNVSDIIDKSRYLL